MIIGLEIAKIEKNINIIHHFILLVLISNS